MQLVLSSFVIAYSTMLSRKKKILASFNKGAHRFRFIAQTASSHSLNYLLKTKRDCFEWLLVHRIIVIVLYKTKCKELTHFKNNLYSFACKNKTRFRRHGVWKQIKQIRNKLWSNLSWNQTHAPQKIGFSIFCYLEFGLWYFANLFQKFGIRLFRIQKKIFSFRIWIWV